MATQGWVSPIWQAKQSYANMLAKAGNNPSKIAKANAYARASGLSTAAYDFQAAQDKANAANQARLTQALGLSDEELAMFRGDNSEYMQGIQAQLGRTKQKYLSSGEQALASSGLWNTSLRAGLVGKFAEEVEVPTLAQAKTDQMRFYADALARKSGILERVQDVGPSPSLVASAAEGAGSSQVTIPSTWQSSPHPWEKNFMGGGWTL